MTESEYLFRKRPERCKNSRLTPSQYVVWVPFGTFTIRDKNHDFGSFATRDKNNHVRSMRSLPQTEGPSRDRKNEHPF